MKKYHQNSAKAVSEAAYKAVVQGATAGYYASPSAFTQYMVHGAGEPATMHQS